MQANASPPPQQQLATFLATEFQELMHRIIAIDNEDMFMSELLSMPQTEIHEKLRAVQTYALRLGFEEAKEMQRGRLLNILANPGTTDSASQPLSPLNNLAAATMKTSSNLSAATQPSQPTSGS
jgi:hypothetical protein